MKNPARMSGDAMSGMCLRAMLLKVHLWVGMVAALFLFALGLSGALLTFEEIIDPALNARAWYVKPQGTPLKLTQITHAIRQAFPQSMVEELVLAQKPDDTVKIIVLQSNGRDVGILVNPYTGEMVGRSDLLFALTGIAIGFEDQVNRWAFAESHMQPAPWLSRKPPAAGVRPLSPDELLAKAESIAPGARPIVLEFGDSPNDPALVIMKFPEDHLGRTHVILDRYTGDVLRFDNTRALPIALKYAR